MTQIQDRYQVVYSKALSEWIVMIDDVGYRLYFDCRAEAEQYVKIKSRPFSSPFVWRELGDWIKDHRHNDACEPNWVRAKS